VSNVTELLANLGPENRGHFTDGKPLVVDPMWLGLNWSGRGRDGFRCHLCGHRFDLGDTFRFVFVDRYPNALICGTCDGSDVIERWKAWVDELRVRAWWWRGR
jgi:hypothetical protein